MRISVWVLVFAVVLLSSCGYLVNENEVKRAVEKQGYTDVQIIRSHRLIPSFTGCSDSDEAGFDIQATNVKGERIDLIACAGWPFKGVTVRSK